MDLVDFILNAAGILLWLGWRADGIDPLAGATPATLAGTIKRTTTNRLQRGQYLFFLGVLILVRAALYVALGPALNWVPRLDCGVVNLAFQSHVFGHQLAFSLLSFIRALLIFVFWLGVLASANRRVGNPDVVHRIILAQLGRTASWPLWIHLLLLPCLAALLWLAAAPLLARMGIAPWPSSSMVLLLQAAVIGAGLFLSLAVLLPALFLLHWISTYVYLGTSPVWDFVSTTSSRLLRPLEGIHLGRLDVAPLAGALIVFAAGNLLPILRWISSWRWFSGTAFSQFINQLVLWPR